MKKCPFCAEEIQDEALFCKHCKNDLTTKAAKKALLKMNQKSFLQRVKEETAKEQAKKEQQQKEREEYLKTLSPEERQQKEHKEKRKKWVKGLWWTAGILGFIAFVNNAYLGTLIFLLAIWLHPKKEELKPKMHFKLKELKNYKLRIFFSILVLFLGFVQIGAEHEEFKKQKEAEFIKNYPSPQIQILSSQEKQGDETEYTLEFTVSDYTNVSVNGESLTEESGKFQKTILLENAKTNISIFAKNEYKNSSKQLVIERNETPEEEKIRLEKEEQERIELEKQKAEEERLKAEEEAKRQAIIEAQKKAEEEKRAKELAEQKEWEASKAGQICKVHPEWTKTDCEKLADNKIWIGMTIDMLKYKRGLPNSANPSDYGYGREWQWCWYNYTPSCFYGDDDGIIDSYN